MDAGNHNPNARVDWSYDPGRFSLTISDAAPASSQIFNNYGPKGNDELLMGYGFCSADNPHDGILLSMRPPPPPLQEMLKTIHPGYFKTTGEWNSDRATFRLLRWQLHDTSDLDAFSRAWAPIPEPLAELFCYIVQFERGFDVAPIESSEEYLYRGSGQRYLPRIALYVAMSLLPKIQRLEQSDEDLPEEPQNSRQAAAEVYRSGQIEVLDEVQERMAAYLKSLLLPTPADPTQHKSALWTLEGALDVLQLVAPDAHKAFMSGLKYCAGTTKFRKIRDSNQEEVLWGVLLCFMYLHYRDIQAGAAGASSVLCSWMRSLETEYGSPLPEGGAAAEAEEKVDEEAAEYISRVKKAAMFLPGSIWTSPAWTSDFVLDWGMRLTKSQGTYMEVGQGDVRFVVYLHIDIQNA